MMVLHSSLGPLRHLNIGPPPPTGMGRKSIKPPKNPNDYKARNGGWKGVFGMAGNVILAAGIREPCRAFQGACQGATGAVRGVESGSYGRQTRARSRCPGPSLRAF